MTKGRWTLPLVAALLIAVGSGIGFAIPSLSGPTGIVSVPTAAVAPTNSLQLALSYQALDVARDSLGSAIGAKGSDVGKVLWDQGIRSADQPTGPAVPFPAALAQAPSNSMPPTVAQALPDKFDQSLWDLQALAGITNQAELGLAYSHVRGGKDPVKLGGHIWSVFGKYQLTKEPQETASLAIGGGLQSWRDALTVSTTSASIDVSTRNAYIVATKDFTPLKGESWEWSSGGGSRMLGSLGLLYLSSDAGLARGESLTKPFVGLEFVGAGGTTLGLEYRWKDDDVDSKAVFSAVLRHAFSPEITAEVGTTNASPIGFGLNDQDFFVRLGYSIPMKGLR